MWVDLLLCKTPEPFPFRSSQILMSALWKPITAERTFCAPTQKALSAATQRRSALTDSFKTPSAAALVSLVSHWSTRIPKVKDQNVNVLFVYIRYQWVFGPQRSLLPWPDVCQHNRLLHMSHIHGDLWTRLSPHRGRHTLWWYAFDIPVFRVVIYYCQKSYSSNFSPWSFSTFFLQMLTNAVQVMFVATTVVLTW